MSARTGDLKLIGQFARALGVCAALMCANALATASAQTPPTRGVEQVMFSVTAEELASALQSLNYVTEISTGSEGRPVVRAYRDAEQRAAANPVFFVALTVCDKSGWPAGCLGMHFARVVRLQPSDWPRAKRVATAFHNKYSWGRAYTAGDNSRLILDYYAFTDRGVTAANIKAVVNEFGGLIDSFQTTWNETP
jgi:hypothetical protein